jgi:tetratricopeptide (TPR) repeat protein
MNGLALAYVRAGQSGESLRLQEETVELAKSILGPDHPNTLLGINNLAQAYQLAGRPEEAITLLEETLKLQKAKLGADHPTTLRTMNSLAIAYREAGRLNDAVPLQEETLKLVKAKLGPDHPDTLINMNNVAVAYLAAGRVTEAVSLDEETFKLIKAKLGPDHPETLRSMNNLGLAYRDAGRFDEALALLDETLKLAKSKLGPDHPFATASMGNLLTTALAAGRATEAQRILDEVLAPALARQPQDSGLLRVRALFFARSARWKEAEADYSRLIELKPDSEEDWHRLAAVLVQEGEAQPYRDHCRKSVERFAETTNPPTAFHIAKDCLVLPDPSANLERVARMAGNALIVGTNNFRWPAMASTRALAEFRQGRFADAADWAERALSPRLLVLLGGARPYVEVETYAVLAMARHQLHQNEAAQAALGSGDKIAQDKLPKLETGDLGENWLGWVFAHALLREAKALIAGGPETKDETK